MNKSRWTSAVLEHRQPLAPMETSVVAETQRLPQIKAVVFDVYGTLVVSGSGDVGSADQTSHDDIILQSMQAAGIVPESNKTPTTKMLHGHIEKMNADRHGPSCPKPEVDIVEAWRRTLHESHISIDDLTTKSVVQLAANFEARANPTWPMPGSSELLRQLAGAGLPLGIVSNAQEFTPCLVENLLDSQTLSEGGFDLDLCVFSNRFRHAKPGPRLFDALREGLARRKILPHEAIYVGNDMLNDIWAASQAGMRTAWFAGDARSCRPRGDDPRCRSLRPDVVLTNLMQLLDCLDLQ